MIRCAACKGEGGALIGDVFNWCFECHGSGKKDDSKRTFALTERQWHTVIQCLNGEYEVADGQHARDLASALKALRDTRRGA